MHETSAQGWCTGKTQRDGMGREAGVGIGKGNTWKSMADSCQCIAKTTTIYKICFKKMDEWIKKMWGVCVCENKNKTKKKKKDLHNRVFTVAWIY